MKPVNLFVLFTALGLTLSPFEILSQQATSWNTPKPEVTAAADGIFAAFRAHPLVGLGDWHGLAQEEDFYVDLIHDPRFAKEVGNLVVEFGGASQQNTMDRYVGGEDIPYEELRKVWTDTVGWIPTVTTLGYLNLFAEVRAVNQVLPHSDRIHVWLGEPPIDWSKIKTQSDITQMSQRDIYPADLIKSQLLAKHKKALVIYGTFHFYNSWSLKPLVEESYPGAFFVVTPYIGFYDEPCSDAFEQTIHDWPQHALAFPVRGTTLEGRMRASGCHFLNEADYHSNPSVTEAQKARLLETMEEQSSGIAGDALLYLGPAASLTESPTTPDIYLDLPFRAEINRRLLIMSEQPLTEATILTAPRYLRSYGRWSNSGSQ